MLEYSHIMKKTFVYSLAFALALAASGTSFAAHNREIEPLPVIAPSPEQASNPPQVEGVSTVAADQQLYDFDALKDQPLHIRRIAVASQLEQIRLKLSGLYDKTKFAAQRLSENGIDSTPADASFALAETSLADAKISIDALALAANDPANQTDAPIMIEDVSFKDAVIAAETKLREGRDAIIAALGALKTAVAPIASPSVTE